VFVNKSSPRRYLFYPNRYLFYPNRYLFYPNRYLFYPNSTLPATILRGLQLSKGVKGVKEVKLTVENGKKSFFGEQI